MEGVSIKDMLADNDYGLELQLLSGESGLSRKTYIAKIQKLGLVIAGHMVYLHPGRIQILGHIEISYLRSIGDIEQRRIIRELCKNNVVCFIVTRNLKVPDFFLSETEQKGIPLLRTKLLTSVFIERVTKFLENRLAPFTYIHGVFIDILGLGVLITGRPGIGKSENALELITKGHRLISDDVVKVKRMGFRELIGEAPSPLKNLLEIRGVGVVDIRKLFGVSSVLEEKRVDLVVDLIDWDESFVSDRLGIEEESVDMLGVKIPLRRVPISPGKNVSTIIELACRNHLLKKEGIDTAKEIEEESLKITMGSSNQ